jgi:hypothetical protein
MEQIFFFLERMIERGLALLPCMAYLLRLYGRVIGFEIDKKPYGLL